MIGGAFEVTLARARTGDEAAFTRIFRDVQPALLRYLRVIATDPEDVAGETWIQVVAGLRRFRGGEQNFRAWLFTIARNRAADAGRSRARRPAVPLDMTEAAQQLTASDAADQALETISTQATMALIKLLPPDQAEIIMLRVVAGLDTGDVARIVGKTQGAVRVAAHRGLRRLAGQVAQAGVTLPPRAVARSQAEGKRHRARIRQLRAHAPYGAGPRPGGGPQPEPGPAEPGSEPGDIRVDSGARRVRPGPEHGLAGFLAPGWLAVPAAACPPGTVPAKVVHARGQ